MMHVDSKGIKFDGFRDYKFAFILYPDDPTHMESLELLKADQDKEIQLAYILHDKDKGKKPHYHVVVAFFNNSKKEFHLFLEKYKLHTSMFAKDKKLDFSKLKNWMSHCTIWFI